MNAQLPSILVSGASGVIGRSFVLATLDRYRIYALARRSQRQARVLPHENLTWIQADIGDWSALKAAAARIKELGGAEFVLHLAGYYDFSYADNPEYRRTNVNGTRHMLELARWLCARRFLFASSLAACSLPSPGTVVTESSPADADFPYARSKREGELLVHRYAALVPCSVLRLAAVFSDWCEYAPLYAFLTTWLSSRWNARILAGRGSSAVGYLHIDDLIRLVLRILDLTDALPPCATYLAGPDGATTHLELHRATTEHALGQPVPPLLMPKTAALLGVAARDLAGRLVGRRPFERPWMLRYVDTRLEADGSATRRALGWQPRDELHILRRIPALVDRLRRCPQEWWLRNEMALRKGEERLLPFLDREEIASEECAAPQVAALSAAALGRESELRLRQLRRVLTRLADTRFAEENGNGPQHRPGAAGGEGSRA